ncbi:MAG TPA: hypothetical protein VFV72_05835 [Candidatus Limnocylindrales bacterium]|nr:hypothetical protein [Candidatus Limnocylindrales bacterium]
MALETEEVLALWREAERILEQLPPGAPERKLVGAEVVKLRRIFKRLTNQRAARSATLPESRSTIESAELTLARARERLGQ